MLDLDYFAALMSDNLEIIFHIFVLACHVRMGIRHTGKQKEVETNKSDRKKINMRSGKLAGITINTRYKDKLALNEG